MLVTVCEVGPLQFGMCLNDRQSPCARGWPLGPCATADGNLLQERGLSAEEGGRP